MEKYDIASHAYSYVPETETSTFHPCSLPVVCAHIQSLTLWHTEVILCLYMTYSKNLVLGELTVTTIAPPWAAVKNKS